MELIRRGISVSGGVVIGPALVLDTEEYRIARKTVQPHEAEHELEILARALLNGQAELQELRDTANTRMGKDAANIFEFHLAMLNDRSVRDRVAKEIQERHSSAAHAVSVVLGKHEQQFAQMQDSFFAERVKDVRDVKKRLLRHVLGEEREDLAHLTQDVILVAHDLTPGQVALLDGTRVRGFVTDVGGRTGHAAIIARSLGLPALVGLGDVTTRVKGGDLLVLDGYHSVLAVEPDRETLDRYRQEVRRFEAFSTDLQRFVHLPAVTEDGGNVNLLANIEFPHEVDIALAKGAAGIGLYRTEYAYLKDSHSAPTEEELYEAYRQTVKAADRRPVVIRTVDLGGDKLPQPHHLVEANPFLGCRSIRYCLQNVDMFRTQLRAILRASPLGDMRMMFPLITSLTEVRQAKSLVRHVMEDLQEEGVPFNRDLKIGIMVETPAAALCARSLAAEVDFFSIGTNDLIQYTLAVDRANERVANLFTPAHPAVLSLIRDVIRVGRQTGVDVSLCGEMAGDRDYLLLLLGLGLETFSMSPSAVPEIKKMVRAVKLADARRVAGKAMTMDSERQVANHLRDESRKIWPDMF